MDIRKIREDFPELAIKVHGKDLVYLDNAASTLKPRQVIDAITRHYSFEAANIHRGVHYLSERGTTLYEETRKKITSFLNAKNDYEIIFTKGTTESINLVANSWGGTNLEAGDEVLISTLAHHSNLVPWQMICEKRGAKVVEVPVNDAGEIDMEAFKKLLGPKTKMVSMTYISNGIGTITPIEEVIKLAHANGTKVLVDAAQAVAHMPIDVQKLDCDFLAFSGHKIFGPTGIGCLYGKEELLEAMPPYQGGGDMIDKVSFAKTTYNDLPHKFEAGTPHIAGGIALKDAIQYVEDLGLVAIMEQEHKLLEAATAKLKEIEGLRIIGEAKNKASVVSFVMDGIHPHDMGTLLDQQGVAIRTGHHCNQPLMERFNVPATARASFCFYNTLEEVDVLVAAIKKVKEFF